MALQEYQKEEGVLLRSRPSSEAKNRDDLKAWLWKRIDDADAVAAELLSSIRDRIEDLGYSADRVLFELFQNADDAYTQLDDVPQQAPFRVEDLGDRCGDFGWRTGGVASSTILERTPTTATVSAGIVISSTCW